MNGTTLEANSVGGDFPAGTINVTGDTGTPIDISTASIQATVGLDYINDANYGGTVSINNASGASLAAIDVNTIINVNGGPETTGPYDGTISLNGVTCQQWLSDNAAAYANSTGGDLNWLQTFWNCAPPVTTETADDGYPQSVTNSALSATLRTTTGTSRINLFVFNNEGDFDSFFSSLETGAAGVTFELGAGPEPTIYSSVFETPSGLSLTQEDISEVTIHEMGHGFESLLGTSNQSGSTAYNTGVQNDFFYLDYITTSGPTYTLRPPCTTGSDGATAPFLNNSNVCTGTTVNPTYSSVTNSAILQSLSGTGPGSYFITHSGAWIELYAQGLAYAAYASSTGGIFYHPLPDNVFQNGFFSCSIGWASQIQMGTLSPTVTSGTEGTCSTNHVPSGYGPWN